MKLTGRAIERLGKMAQRTYLYGLWLAMTALSRYISRWIIKLEGSMDTQQFLCLQAVVTAIDECLPLIQPPPPNV